MLNEVLKEYINTYRFRNVIYCFVSYVLRARYRRSILGFLWTVLAPLSTYLVLGIVFSWALKMPVQNFLVYILSGLVLFNLINASVGHGPSVFIDNENYIKKIYLPKTVFVLNMVLLEAVNFILTFLSLLFLGLILGKLTLGWSYLYLIFPVCCTFLLLIGTSHILGILTVYFRDLKHILPALMLGIFYITPILYPVDMVPAKFSYLVTYNPFYYFVSTFRSPLLSNALPPIEHSAFILIFSVVVFLTGGWAVVRFGNKVVFKL